MSALTGNMTWVSGGVSHTIISYTDSVAAAGNPFWDESTNKVDFGKYAQNLG